MIWGILLLLLLIAFSLAFLSLPREKNTKEVQFVNRELKKGRVIYDKGTHPKK
jgi:preprotein translocase subunit YajC